MAKYITFGMYWEMYSRQTLPIPDDIDENDPEALKKYIKENWEDVPIPLSTGEYVVDSDHLDEDSEIYTTNEK